MTFDEKIESWITNYNSVGLPASEESIDMGCVCSKDIQERWQHPFPSDSDLPWTYFGPKINKGCMLHGEETLFEAIAHFPHHDRKAYIKKYIEAVKSESSESLKLNWKKGLRNEREVTDD